MQRFVLQQNIDRFQALIDEAPDAPNHRQIRSMLATAERELALLNAGQSGVLSRPALNAGVHHPPESRARLVERFHSEYDGSPKLAALIDPEPGLLIVDVNPTYEQSTGLSRAQMAGQPLFLLFPDNPDDPQADGVSHLYASLREVAETGRPHTMADQRYDVRDGDGRFVERHWRPANSAVSDEAGQLVFLLHLVEEVTEEVMAGRRAGP